MDRYASSDKTINEAIKGGGLLVVAQWETKEGQADKVADILARFLPEAQREEGAKLFGEHTAGAAFPHGVVRGAGAIHQDPSHRFRRRTEEVLGQNMHGLIHHSHADGRHYPECDCPIFNAFRSGVPCRIDSEVLWRRDGSSFAAEYSSYPILEGGEVHGAVVTFVDITETKRAERMQAARVF